MSVVIANVKRTIGDGYTLTINAQGNGWVVGVVNEETNYSISTGPHRFQLDGVIDILSKHWRKDRSDENKKSDS